MSQPHGVACSFVSNFRRLFAVVFCAALLVGSVSAQVTATVPNLVKFSGTVSSAPAGSVGVIFALYADQTGGAPLWQEVQNVSVDGSGHYTSLLGSSTAAGIPLEVFSSNEARWLGVQVQGQAEQARILLVSVPYALKAADAQTLGGLPPSAFLRADTAATTTTPPSTTAYINTAAVNADASRAVANVTNPSLTPVDDAGWLAGYLPVFDASGNLENSLVAQSGSNVGIGTASPIAALHLFGVNPTMRIEQYGPVGSGDSPNFNFYTGNGTAASPAATQDGDNLGQFAASGWNGTGFPASSKVKVSFVAVGPWTANANGTAITFQTTSSTDTSAKRTERMRIADNGFVGIGTTTPSAVLSVNGDVALTGGSVGIGTTSPGAPLEVTGNVKLSEDSGGQIIFPDGSMIGSTNPLTAAKIETTGGTTGTGSVTTNTVNAETLNATGAVTAATLNLSGELTAASLETTGGTEGEGSVTTNTVDAETVNTANLNLESTLTVPSLTTTGGTAGTGTVTTNALISKTLSTNALGVGNLTASGYLETESSVYVDANGENDGASLIPGLVFGGSGSALTGISANQTAQGENPGGMDFGTAGMLWLQIQKTGEVGIGIGEGDEASSALDVTLNPASTYPVAIFGENPPLSDVATSNLLEAADANLTVGVWGDGGTGDAGVDGSPASLSIGVVGTGDFSGGKFWTDGIGAALQAQYEGASSTATVLLAMGLPDSGGGYKECEVDASGNLSCTGAISGSVVTPGTASTGSAAAQRVAVYAVQSPENWFEDFGSATLSNGVANVAIEATFAQTVNTGVEYHVFLTPNGESEGLYVAQKSATSFEVRETHGGHSNISFDYRIVAKRAGYENLRMPDVTEKFAKIGKLGTTLTAQALPPSIMAKMKPARPKRFSRISPARTNRGPAVVPQVLPAPKGTLK